MNGETGIPWMIRRLVEEIKSIEATLNREVKAQRISKLNKLAHWIAKQTGSDIVTGDRAVNTPHILCFSYSNG